VKKPALQWPLYGALVVLYLLHNDLWLWHDGSRVFGLPVGLVYHVGFAVATSVVLTLLVIYAWPDHLEVADAEAHDAKQDAGNAGR
jgi:uncharacterized oligopeptide transporter (OPT) family protein